MVTPKKRKNMKHLHEMNDYDFCQWMLQATNTTMELSWKLDGFFLRFGKTATGVPWFQTARSPVIYDPMDLVWYAVGKSEEAMVRAENYFHLIKSIWYSKIMDSLEDDTGFECEVFDKSASILKKENGTRTFVNVPYLDSFFPKNITLAVYRKIKSSTGETLSDRYAFWTPVEVCDIAVFGTRFNINVDMRYFRECITYTLHGEPMRALKSLKHADRELKLRTKEKVAVLKAQLGAYILDKARMQTQMGPYFEGVVVSVNNIEFKITTDYFRTLIAMKEVLGG